MATRRSSRVALSKKELEKQVNESFSSTDDEEKRDKELFADVDGSNAGSDVNFNPSGISSSDSEDEEDIPDSPKGRYVKVISKQKNNTFLNNLNNVNQQKSHKPDKNDDSTPK